MGPTPAVSVILPVFNGERYLAEALDSILIQDAGVLDIVVVDDGSSDRTQEVLDRYQNRLRVKSQENRGPAAARNAGIRLAQAPLLAFLDADDVWMPGKLSRQLAALSSRPALGLVLAHIENFWEPELGPVADRVRNHPASAPRPGYYFQAMLARRELFDTIGELDESLCPGEDLDWFVRALERGVLFEMLPEMLVRRRIHGRNLTGLGGGDPNRFLEILRSSLLRRRKGATGGLPAPRS